MNNPGILITGNREILNITRIENLLYSNFSIFEIHGIENIVRSIINSKIDIIISCSNHTAVDDALRVAKEIRGRGLRIPIILIVRHSSEDLFIAAIKSGIDDCFKIPFPKEAILKSINNNILKSFFINKESIPGPENNLNDISMLATADLAMPIRLFHQERKGGLI